MFLVLISAALSYVAKDIKAYKPHNNLYIVSYKHDILAMVERFSMTYYWAMGIDIYPWKNRRLHFEFSTSTER